MTTKQINPQAPILGEELPKPRFFEELALLVIDLSQSMSLAETESKKVKWRAVKEHLIDSPTSWLQRMQVGQNRDVTYVALITFDHRVDVALSPMPLLQTTPADLEFDISKHCGSTAIGRALKEARQLAEDWLSHADPNVPRYVTILLMSDGEEQEGTNPLSVADAVKSIGGKPGISRNPITIATARYGDNADKNLLESMASQRGRDGEPMSKQVQTGEELRDFFIESMTVATAVATP